VARARRVRVEGEHLAAAVDDRELVDQSFEFGDQVGRDEHRATPGLPLLIRADDGLDEFAPDDRIESGRGLVEHEQLWFGADRRDQGHLRALSFGELTRLLRHIEPKLSDQFAFGVPIPVGAKRGEVIERLAYGHPGVKRDVIRHVCEPRLDGHFVARRIEAEQPDLTGRGPQQVQQTLDRGRLAGAVAAEKAVAAAGLHAKVQTVDRVGPPVSTNQSARFDDRSLSVHDS
jgi:hypothetical protein